MSGGTADRKIQRRLAAIFAADVEGYSRLMGMDEVGTVRTLTAHREIMDRLIGEHGGRIANTAGDGLLAEFPSVVDAVRAAVEVQEALGTANEVLPEDRRLRFRIGVHVGDVMVKGGDLFGEGVNIAARLQALAEPGGVCISGDAQRHVRKTSPFHFTDLGPQQVKNIAEPVSAFRVDVGLLGSDVQSPLLLSKSLPVPDRPSIAVLPFVNMSRDADDEYFSDGITEDLITALSRIRWLFVIARNSTFVFKRKVVDLKEIGRQLGVRYVLEGSIRRAGHRVRVTGQLIEAATGAHIWAERYDRDLTDIFELQDEITSSVVGAIEPNLRKAEIDCAKRKRPEDLDAYDLYLRALAHMYDVRQENRAAALDFTTQALTINPDYAEAHGVAAWCYFAKSLWEGGLPEPYREAMLKHARAVQELQPEDASTLAHAAIALALGTRDYEASVEMIERAIAINPSSVHAHGHGSVINTWAGHYDRSIALSERALRLSPLDPLRVMPLAGQAGAWLMKGEYETALAFARRALQVYPTHTPSYLISIASLIRLDRVEEARRVAREFMALYPQYRILRKGPVLEHFCDELREAGLSE
jgi:TolB-like protein/class 3 adenylate cyclase/Tfp pilus assembly protein PilF